MRVNFIGLQPIILLTFADTIEGVEHLPVHEIFSSDKVQKVLASLAKQIPSIPAGCMLPYINFRSFHDYPSEYLTFT